MDAIPKQAINISPDKVVGMVHITDEPYQTPEHGVPIRVDHNIDLHYENKSMLDGLRFWVMNFLIWWVVAKKRLLPKTYFPFLWIFFTQLFCLLRVFLFTAWRLTYLGAFLR